MLTGRTGHNFNYAIGTGGYFPAVGPAFRGGLSIVLGFPFDQLPKRYGVDENGRRVMLGLSVEETFEFETLDDLAPSDNSAWRDDVPITIREKRWLELYQKHEDAWRKMQAERVARPRPR